MFFSGKDEIDEREPIFFSGDDAELVCLPPNGLVSDTGNASTFFSGTPPAQGMGSQHDTTTIQASAIYMFDAERMVKISSAKSPSAASVKCASTTSHEVITMHFRSAQQNRGVTLAA
ncbi:unnamed protein product [Urochloa humidicola]